MLEHDHAGRRRAGASSKANGLDENTIIWYSTDNGPEHSSWPHGGTTPFRGEKMTTYEGGVRVISMLRWPGTIKPDQMLNGIQAHMDMFTSLAAAAGVPDVDAQVMQRQEAVHRRRRTTSTTGSASRPRVHAPRLHLLLRVQVDGGALGPWKSHFATKEDYYAPVVARTAAPLVFNVRMDPFESYSSIDSYGHLLQKSSWQLAPLGEIMNAHLKTLVDYPPVQGGNSFDMSNIVQEVLSKARQ